MKTGIMKKDADGMSKRSRRNPIKVVLTLAALALAVCLGKVCLERTAFATDDRVAQTAPRQSPLVRVQEAEMGDVAVVKDYIGVVEALQTASLRPEVSAKIEKVHFKEGAHVKAGDVLFTLDNKQFQATVALRKAEVAKAEANYGKAQKYYERLKAADKRSVSAADVDAAYNDVQQGKAMIEEAKASLRLAQIDLNNTRITAPISGRIGRTDYTTGNYVSPSGEALTTIVQTDPVRVSFSLPDRDYLEELDAFNESAGNVYNATLRLANGDEFPHKGERDFEDNTMDTDSGTIGVSLRFKNDKNALVPGSMVRVSLAPREEKRGVLVLQESVLSDREGDYVYVVDSNEIVNKRRVSLGAEIGEMREIVAGIEKGESVVVQGMHSLKSEMKVRVAESGTAKGDTVDAAANDAKPENRQAVLLTMSGGQ